MRLVSHTKVSHSFAIVGAMGLAYLADFGELASLGAVILIMLRCLSYAQGVQSCIQNMHAAAPYLEALDIEERAYRRARAVSGTNAVSSVHAIRFEQVGFEYKIGEPVLHDLSFELGHGEIVGIVGPSGSGKSTLIQLLLRLRDPANGCISVQGHDVRSMGLREWYRHVAFVPQEPKFYAGTVADNIRFHRSDICG